MTPPKNDTATKLAYFEGHTDATLESIAQALDQMRRVHEQIFARLNDLPCGDESNSILTVKTELRWTERWLGALWGLFISGAAIAVAWAWKQKGAP